MRYNKKRERHAQIHIRILRDINIYVMIFNGVKSHTHGDKRKGA